MAESEVEVFVMADRALAEVVANIRDDQWALPIPNDIPMAERPGGPPTLRQVINYHAYDDAWVPDMLAGHTMEQAGADNFDGDLLGQQPVMAFNALVDRACSAAMAADDLNRVVHCSFGDYPAREYLWQINSFRGLRAHDLAWAIGMEPRLPAALVRGLWDEISPHAEEWRAIGVFGPAVDVPADAPLLHRLLGITGRTPRRG